MNPKELYKIKPEIPKQGKFIYFEDLYPEIMNVSEIFEDDAFIVSKGFEIARGWIDPDSPNGVVSCGNCNATLCSNEKEIEQYAICPNCGAVLVDIEY